MADTVTFQHEDGRLQAAVPGTALHAALVDDPSWTEVDTPRSKRSRQRRKDAPDAPVGDGAGDAESDDVETLGG